MQSDAVIFDAAIQTQQNISLFPRNMLAMGKSKPWPDALEKMTGTRKMDVGALKEYFEPLNKWLVKQREAKKYPKGWSTEGAYEECKVSSSKCPFGPAIFTIISSLLATLAYLF